MTAYKNGQVPRSVMKQFRNTGKYGHPVFIDHLEAAFQECAANGIALYIGSGQDINRDIAGQQYWRNYWCGRGLCGNAAAVGTSNHGFGIAADISGNGTRGTARWNKVQAIFAKHGLVFDVASEGWHCRDKTISTAGGVVNIDGPSKGEYSGNPYFPTLAAFAAVQGGYNVLGYGLTQDGRNGPKTAAAVGDFQSKHGLVRDNVHGPATERALIAAVAAKQATQQTPPPAPNTNPYGLSDIRGIQKIAKANGYKGAIDNIWGGGTKAGFDKFLASQGGLGSWLRRRWGYVGNDVFGPKMREALARANAANFKAL
jgi:peptidoglycan hydrolase-like protein with peptidoglycan-binding domain